MGLTRTYSDQALGTFGDRDIGLDESISRIAVNFPRMLGIFGASALALLALSRPKGSIEILNPLACPCLLWAIVMRNHMAVHDIEMLLAAPLAAVALAWVVVGVLERRTLRATGWAITGLLVTGILVQP